MITSRQPRIFPGRTAQDKEKNQYIKEKKLLHVKNQTDNTL